MLVRVDVDRLYVDIFQSFLIISMVVTHVSCQRGFRLGPGEDGWGGSEEVTAGGHWITRVTCHVPFSLILQCYKSLYLISENACA